MSYPMWVWIGFSAFVLSMLALDLLVVNRKAHFPSYKETLMWSAVWVGSALAFNTFIFYQFGTQKGFEFLTGYIIELSLSVDNLFVFLLVFAYFKVPKDFQHRVLFWGVMGALIMRVIMIFIGAELIERFHWVIYVFGAFLIYTGIKMFKEEEAEIEPEKNPAIRFVQRFIPITHHYDGEKFFTMENGKRVGTLLFLVLVVVEITDLVFAVDSIPAIFGITTDRFIVYTSNVFAILGLRTFFFLLSNVIDKFHYLRLGLAAVLTFIGVKMVLPLLGDGAAYVLNQAGNPQLAETVKHYDHIPVNVSLGVVVVVLALSILASLVFPQKHKEQIGDYETNINSDLNFGEDNSVKRD
ncbi:MAG: TerC family protein [Acidobacteriota bacterium]|nr:TerC family protein [Acidobacteriota bacterium]